MLCSKYVFGNRLEVQKYNLMDVKLCYLWPVQQKAPRGVPTYYQCGLLLSVCCAFQQVLGQSFGTRQMNLYFVQFYHTFLLFHFVWGFGVFTFVLLISLLINVTFIAKNPQTCHIIFWCLTLTITPFGVSVQHLPNIIIYFKYVLYYF